MGRGIGRYTAALLCAAGLCVGTLSLAAGSNAAKTRPAQGMETGALAGWIVAVDAGHGGYDGGAVGRQSGVAEKGLNLDVARRLARLLQAEGAQVVMTRTDDYALCDEDPQIRKKLQDMQRRAQIVREAGAQVLLSVHMNEYGDAAQSGPQVFYREGCAAGRLLAGALQEALIAGLAPPRERAAMGGDYYILELGIPSALVECGFLSNPREEGLLLDAEYRQRVAEAICAGLLEWAALPGPRPTPLPPAQDA